MLRASEAVCAARAVARAEGAIADYTPYRELYADFSEGERYMICDDIGEASVVATRIREGLDGGAFRLS